MASHWAVLLAGEVQFQKSRELWWPRDVDWRPVRFFETEKMHATRRRSAGYGANSEIILVRNCMILLCFLREHVGVNSKIPLTTWI